MTRLIGMKKALFPSSRQADIGIRRKNETSRNGNVSRIVKEETSTGNNHDDYFLSKR